MKVLVTGAGGQLGRTLLAVGPPDVTMVGVGRSQLDIAEPDQVLTCLRRERPDVVVNCAAYSAVDLAESEVAKARKANAAGPENLAIVARDSGARLIHLSTDYVFDGRATVPYPPNAPQNPLSAYGASKCEGEQRIRDVLPGNSVVLRSSWLYSEYGGNFVSTMLRLFRERENVSVVNDQTGSPTWARSVADAIFAFVAKPDIAGTYHWSDAGQASWYDFACAIHEEALDLGLLDKKVDIRAIATSEYQAAAKRPAYSVLDCSSTSEALGLVPTPWRQNLRAMLEVIAR